MKIETSDKGEMILKEVYSGVILQAEKESIGICMRDGGFELTYNGTVFEVKEGLVKYRDVTFEGSDSFKWTDELVIEFAGDGTRQMREMHQGLMDAFKASKQPNPEWEIVEGINDKGYVFQWANNHPHFMDDIVGPKCSIHSVKRLSDGEVFTVGGMISVPGGFWAKITRFELSKDGKSMAAFSGDDGWQLQFIRPATGPFPDSIPPAANGKVPVWLTRKEMERLHQLLTL
jgi:hypothetical protein